MRIEAREKTNPRASLGQAIKEKFDEKGYETEVIGTLNKDDEQICIVKAAKDGVTTYHQLILDTQTDKVSSAKVNKPRI